MRDCGFGIVLCVLCGSPPRGGDRGQRRLAQQHASDYGAAAANSQGLLPNRLSGFCTKSRLGNKHRPLAVRCPNAGAAAALLRVKPKIECVLLYNMCSCGGFAGGWCVVCESPRVFGAACVGGLHLLSSPLSPVSNPMANAAGVAPQARGRARTTRRRCSTPSIICISASKDRVLLLRGKIKQIVWRPVGGTRSFCLSLSCRRRRSSSSSNKQTNKRPSAALPLLLLAAAIAAANERAGVVRFARVWVPEHLVRRHHSGVARGGLGLGFVVLCMFSLFVFCFGG